MDKELKNIPTELIEKSAIVAAKNDVNVLEIVKEAYQMGREKEKNEIIEKIKSIQPYSKTDDVKNATEYILTMLGE